MTDFYLLQPEVAGGWGPNTVADGTGHPPTVVKLHYEFEGWVGDQLLESFPCFIATDVLAEQFSMHHLTGFSIDDVEVSTSETFRELYPNRELPKFVWLRVAGVAKVDDFGLTADARLIVSERALRIIQTTNPTVLEAEKV